ncbi:MAG: glycosyltransferase [Pyrinomonadaceae bacterium]
MFIERKPGASRSIERVFRQIDQALPDDQFTTEFQSVPYGNGISAILRNLLFFRPQPADIYHITGDVHYIALVLPGKKTLLTIHDLIFLHGRSGLRRFVLKKLFLDLPLKRVARVTTVSKTVKGEIVSETAIRDERFTVIDNPLNKDMLARESKPFNRHCPTILHIGTGENKNLATLLTAVRGLPCRLRIVGRLPLRIVEQLNSNEIVYENIFDLDDEKMADEYRRADIVSFCSTYEGFGLPIIEAQGMMKPLVTSDLPPMNIMAGAGAALVDPLDERTIRNALDRIIGDESYRSEIVRLGSENVRRFDRGDIADQYRKIYLQIFNGSNDETA